MNPCDDMEWGPLMLRIMVLHGALEQQDDVVRLQRVDRTLYPWMQRVHGRQDRTTWWVRDDVPSTVVLDALAGTPPHWRASLSQVGQGAS